MSLPGLQLSAPVEPAVAPPIVHELKQNTEWRFEVAFGAKVEVKLLSGHAELFGTEIAIKQVYTFSGTKAAIYTWHGCSIEAVGDCEAEYVAEETPMISYANLHFAMEKAREEAAVDGADGPRVLVVGPDNAGKTSLVKLLTAYAIRCGRQPVAVNLDVKEGMLSLPGSLSTATFSSILDVEEGWGSSPTNGPCPVPVKLPLVYYMGLANPEDNIGMFKAITARLALSVMNKLKDDNEAKEAGCIVDTPGIISQGKGGYESIQHIVSEFAINIILVLGSERLNSDLLRRFSNQRTPANEPITVLKLDKSGGCVDRDERFLQQSRLAQIREYFFGDAKNPLSPHTQQIDFDQVSIYKLAEANPLLDSLLPGDATEEDVAPALFDRVTPSPQMQNALLAIVQANPVDTQENIRDASVIGFLYVDEVDEKRRKIKILAPLPGRLPNRALVWGAWPEGIGSLVG